MDRLSTRCQAAIGLFSRRPPRVGVLRISICQLIIPFLDTQVLQGLRAHTRRALLSEAASDLILPNCLTHDIIFSVRMQNVSLKCQMTPGNGKAVWEHLIRCDHTMDHL